MIAIVAMFAMSATAQTVKPSKFLDNTAVTVKGGVSGLVHPGCNGYENLGHTFHQVATVMKTLDTHFKLKQVLVLRNGSLLHGV